MMPLAGWTLEALLTRAGQELLAEAEANGRPFWLDVRTLAVHVGLTSSSLAKGMRLVKLAKGYDWKGLTPTMVVRAARGQARACQVGSRLERAPAREGAQLDVWKALERSTFEPGRFDAFVEGARSPIVAVAEERAERAPLTIRFDATPDVLNVPPEHRVARLRIAPYEPDANGGTSHHCHARGCQREVPPKLLMCGVHWRMVPPDLQRAVWATYRPGQEIDKRPTRDYLAAAKDAIRWVAQAEGRLEKWQKGGPDAESEGHTSDLDRAHAIPIEPETPPRRFVAVDVETTADKEPRIIEIGLVFFEDGKVVGRMEQLFHPERRLHWRCTNITGIRDSDLAGKPLFEQLAPTIRKALERSGTVVGHNLAGTDKPRIKQELEWAGLSWPEVEEVDTLKIAKKLLKRSRGNGLGNLCERFGIAYAGDHRAGADAEACGHLLLALEAEQAKQGNLV